MLDSNQRAENSAASLAGMWFKPLTQRANFISCYTILNYYLAGAIRLERISYDFGDRYFTIKLHPYIGGSGEL